jgi:UDP-N-acetylglucosamine 2-epimerase (non-hydrolysing)
MAPVIRAMKARRESIAAYVCSTGQHREMLDQVLERFKIKVDVELNLMEPNQSLERLTAKALTGVSEVLSDLAPELVLVQGDTTTAMASALASFYQKIPVGHVEAGLRSFDRYSPFPEEMNRKLISALAIYHFAPTKTAKSALIQEGVPESNVFLTGNPVIDALYMLLEQPVEYDWSIFNDDLKLILVTAHRRENHGAPLRDICRALKEIARLRDDIEIAYPVHLNPNVQQAARSELSGVSRIHLLPPVSYDVFVHLMQRSHLILTDSGGVQEEAPALNKPVLVLRRETERMEGVEAGVARLVGTKTEDIVSHVQNLLQNHDAYQAMARSVCPYGDGHAAERIVECILRHAANLKP